MSFGNRKKRMRVGRRKMVCNVRVIWKTHVVLNNTPHQNAHFFFLVSFPRFKQDHFFNAFRIFSNVTDGNRSMPELCAILRRRALNIAPRPLFSSSRILSTRLCPLCARSLKRPEFLTQESKCFHHEITKFTAHLFLFFSFPHITHYTFFHSLLNCVYTAHVSTCASVEEDFSFFFVPVPRQ